MNCPFLHVLSEVYTFLGIKYGITKTIKTCSKDRKSTHTKTDRPCWFMSNAMIPPLDLHVSAALSLCQACILFFLAVQFLPQTSLGQVTPIFTLVSFSRLLEVWLGLKLLAGKRRTPLSKFKDGLLGKRGALGKYKDTLEYASCPQ